MAKAFWFIAATLLATTIAIAQDAPASSSQESQTTSHSSTTQNTVIRGCLSGSSANYTLTDQNGMQYKVMGDDATLAGKVGHEVEINGTENQSTEATSQGGEAMAHSSNSVQASNVRDVSSTCKMGASGSSQPLSDSNGMSPKGTPETTEHPKPQLMAMLLQQSSLDSGTQTQNGTSGQPKTSPPVTSQTPAGSNSPMGSSPQAGSSPANNTGMSESEANHDAQAARQGELNTNPKTGQTTGRGVNNQGENNPSQTSPNAVPNSRNSTDSPATPPQANADDQNKPLYARPATNANGNSSNTAPSNPPQQ